MQLEGINKLLIQMAAIIIAVGALAYLIFGSSGDKSIYTKKCGAGTLQLELVTKTENAMVGPKTHVQLTYLSDGSSRRVDHFGYQPPSGIVEMAKINPSVVESGKEIKLWKVIIESLSFNPEERREISSCLQEFGHEMNEALAKQNFKQVWSVNNNNTVLQIGSVNFFESVYSHTDAKDMSMKATNKYYFTGPDQNFIHIKRDNSVWLHGPKISSRIGYIDASTRTFIHSHERRSVEFVERFFAVLKVAKNSDGKMFADLFKMESK